MKTRIIVLLFVLLVFVPSVLAQSGGEESPTAGTPTPAASAGEVPVRKDTPVTVHLVGDVPVNLGYKTSGEEIISITARSLEADGVLDPLLTVIDPTGASIAENDDHRTSRTDLAPRDALIADLNLSDSGRYLIQVRNFDASVEGDVEIVVSTGSASAPEQPPASETVNDRVPDNDVFNYTIQANEGEVLTITVRARDNQLDPKVALLDSSESEIASNDDHTLNDPTLGPYDSQIVDVEIPKTDTYTIQISGFAGIGGDFELSIDRGDGSTQPLQPTTPPTIPTQPPAESRDVVQGTVETNDVYTYAFEAEAGDVYTITAQAASGDLDPRIAVYLNDSFIADNDDYGTTDPDLQATDARIYNLILDESGRYEVDVRGYLDSSGGFTLTVERAATDAPTGLPTEQVELGSVTSGETYSLDLDARAGDWVTISVRGLTNDFDSYVALVSADGTVLIDNDDNGSAFLGALGYLDSQITNYH
ncbi:MAG: hypothetical protein IT319_01235, partial [Anaerolineae bacterium]|nr:hypothetical protein [Anaerolineae bacterium]